MFFEPAEITELLNCENCSQPYGEYYPPRILPCCGKTICYKCVQQTERQIKDNILKCIVCNKEEMIPVHGFQINRALVKLIAKKPKEISRGHEAEKLKQNLRDLDIQVNKLVFEVENGEYLITGDCLELRRQIKLAREERIKEINQQCDVLLHKIDTFEEKCIRKYREMNVSTQQVNELIDLVNSAIQQQNSYLMQLMIDDKDTMAYNVKMNELKSIIKTERKNIKKLMYDNQIMKFEVNSSSIDENLLGKLIHITPDFSKILVASHHRIKMFDLITGQCLKTFQGHSNWVQSVKLLNENQIVTCSTDKSIKIWDLTTGNCIRTLLGHSDAVFSIVILSDDRIASCSQDKTIRIWEAESGCCIKILNGHTEIIRSIVALPNHSSGNLLSCSADKTIKLWNVDSGECLTTFTGHDKPVVCLEVLSDEKILSGSCDKTIKVWNVNTGLCLQTLKGHLDFVRCIKILSDERIISGSEDKTMKIWCLKTNSCIITINGHSDAIRGIQVLSGDKVASCSNDKTFKIWDLASASCVKTFQSESGILSINAF